MTAKLQECFARGMNRSAAVAHCHMIFKMISRLFGSRPRFAESPGGMRTRQTITVPEKGSTRG